LEDEPVPQSFIKENVSLLLKETFEGAASTGPSAFLNKGTGLFQTLEEVSVEAASTQTKPGGSTVAAHTEHVRFYVDVHDKLMLTDQRTRLTGTKAGELKLSARKSGTR
jgi:hypothetical protein